MLPGWIIGIFARSNLVGCWGIGIFETLSKPNLETYFLLLFRVNSFGIIWIGDW
jgi:hypothetical protein